MAVLAMASVTCWAQQTERTGMIGALERFETAYNLVDGTDYGRLTMSAEAWELLVDQAIAVSEALGDDGLVMEYAQRTAALTAQMAATDASMSLFREYQELLGVLGESYAADTDTDSDAHLKAAIERLRAAVPVRAVNDNRNQHGTWYTVGGRLLTGLPAKKGLYIHKAEGSTAVYVKK